MQKRGGSSISDKYNNLSVKYRIQEFTTLVFWALLLINI